MPSMTYAESIAARALHAATITMECDPKNRNRMAREARRTYKAFRISNGYKDHAKLFTSPDSQYKLGKSKTPSYGLMLTPAQTLAEYADEVADMPDHVDVKRVNACPWATLGCLTGCLNTAGRGGMDSTQRARLIRHAFMFQNPESFGILLGYEIVAISNRHPGGALIRLNVITDYRWEIMFPSFFESLPRNVRAYDYTAVAPTHRGALPSNYSLTYSVKETWDVDRMLDYYRRGLNIAAVVDVKRGQPLPGRWHGMPVIDGDVSDDRTRDSHGVVLLRAKGKAIGDTTGFVWPVDDTVFLEVVA